MKKLLFLLAASVFSCVYAEVKLSTIFGDNMVLQRNVKVPIHGTAAPREKVTVQFNGQKVSTTADSTGKWIVYLAPMPACKKGQDIKIYSDKNAVTVKNVLIGEVWLCSGQSNMEMPLWTDKPRWRATDGNIHAKEGRNDLIRYVTVKHQISNYASPGTLPMQWHPMTDDNVFSFSATAFYFGQELQKALDIPVGLISSCWSGSKIEPWIPPAGFDSVPELKTTAYAVRAKLPGTPEYAATNKKIIAAYEKWLADFKLAAANNQPRPDFPKYPSEAVPYPGVQYPAMTYNKMIYPLLPFAIKGAIWYQGCSNVNEGKLYGKKMQALLNGWRKVFENPELHFYLVQLAPYTYKNPTALPQIWEVQQQFARDNKNTGTAIINDIGDFKDIHPHNKKDVGKRLAMLAAKHTYKQNIKADSPELASWEIKGNKFILKFKNVEKWITKNTDKNFEVADIYGIWHRAKFEISNTDLIVYADNVSEVYQLRYMFHQHPKGNLWNEVGLPLGTFHCGKEMTASPLVNKLHPNAALIYECNLLNATTPDGSVKYTINNSASFKGKVKKIIYHVILKPKDKYSEWAVISMDAFTDDVRKIGIPVQKSGFSFAGPVKNIQVTTNSKNIKTKSAAVGRIEFWSGNYGYANVSNVPNASSTLFDFGDEKINGGNYGSMQIHNPAEKETIFAFNSFTTSAHDLGLGNRPQGNPDWTFAKNSKSYSQAILKIYAE